jgi:hypothetical protein
MKRSFPAWTSSGFNPTEYSGVGRIDDDQSLAQILPQGALAHGDGLQQEGRHVAVEVEKYESAACFDILLYEIADEVRLAASCLAKQCKVFRPAVLSDADAGIYRLALHDTRPYIKRPVVHRNGVFPDATVPEASDIFFEPTDHTR